MSSSLSYGATTDEVFECLGAFGVNCRPLVGDLPVGEALQIVRLVARDDFEGVRILRLDETVPYFTRRPVGFHERRQSCWARRCHWPFVI